MFSAGRRNSGSNTTEPEALAHTDARNGTDRPRQYLQDLVWDRHPRLGTWLTDYMGAEDTPYVEEVGRRWFVNAAVACMDTSVSPFILVFVSAEHEAEARLVCQALGDPSVSTFIELSNRLAIVARES